MIHPYPHIYRASAVGVPARSVTVRGVQLPDIATAAPPEFDGPAGFWSPETLLCAAVADCFILTFRGISRVAKLDWQKLECRVEGTLERVEGQPQFTRFSVFATLTVPAATDPGKARSLLERAEHQCLISNSVRAVRTLEAEIVSASAPSELPGQHAA